MIINCKCGKYQFDVKKSDIGLKGREVQCGICNEKWFHGSSADKPANYQQAKSADSYKTPLLHKFIFLLITFITLIGFFDLIKNFLVKTIPVFQDYFILKQAIILKLITLIQ